MPLLDITLAAGRSPEQIRHLIHEVHAAVLRSTGVPPSAIKIVVREVPRTHWAEGDVTISERPGQPNQEKTP